MKEKLNTILLIDDNEADNYLHKMVIEELGCAKQVEVVYDGEEAIQYLTQEKNGVIPIPDIIFLDINMPKMNGWEFLEAYEQLVAEEQRCQALVLMLTTSLNPDDYQLADQNENIKAFMNKPLTVDQLLVIMKKNFPGKFESFLEEPTTKREMN